MAYLDDNNENLYTPGDPLEDLDRELAELKASLEELDDLVVPPSDTKKAKSEDHPELK